MNTTDKNKLEEQDIIEDMENEIEEIKDEEGQIDEERLEEAVEPNTENNSAKELLAKTMADFENYKKRVERDRDDMIFFLKWDIFKIVLPRIDDLERIIKNTPKEEQNTPIYQGVLSIINKLMSDLEKMWVKPFDSIWEEVNPDLHEVITMIPWKKEWIIVDEFEKWYKLNWKVLRYAKVITWAGEN